MSSELVYPVGAFLKRAQHAYRLRVDRDLRALDLTAPQYAVLAAIQKEHGLSNADLSRVAFVKPSTMLGLISNLERADLIIRSPHPEQARVLRTALTESGTRVFEQAQEIVESIERVLCDAVGVANVPEFIKLLSRCADRLEG
ncbi:MarR family winged helix-turn-helix transcriptional regulator [Rhizobium glycinendophyticum]|uniref:MarR family transcriptional regulator n=1 Tax=Rhizobium glycinendophyticum TaxID=2589807 RepID=A0A504TQG7_9HYPH|nr:MarR family transcriptional regulator [Rhizobium glycinendophyticum]TPP05028.1 MarR family transcriptional regulator [Rhizobium glycinendophyticum]